MAVRRCPIEGSDDLPFGQGQSVHLSEIPGAPRGLRHSALGGTHGGVTGRVPGFQSLNAALKNERAHRMVYPTKRKAISDIVSWIDLRYNHVRLHSALGYRAPNEIERDLLGSSRAS